MAKRKEQEQPRKHAIRNEAGREGKPITFAPLSFDEAIDGLLQVDAQAVRKLERQAAEKRKAKK